MQNEEYNERRDADKNAHAEIHNILVNVQAVVTDTKDRISSIDRRLELIDTAFVKNDLGKPDYDQHRKDQLNARKTEETLNKYKFEFTKSLLKWVGVTVAALLLSGVFNKAATLLGAPGA